MELGIAVRASRLKASRNELGLREMISVELL
jgi:hypothetical protein